MLHLLHRQTSRDSNSAKKAVKLTKERESRRKGDAVPNATGQFAAGSLGIRRAGSTARRGSGGELAKCEADRKSPEYGSGMAVAAEWLASTRSIAAPVGNGC